MFKYLHRITSFPFTQLSIKWNNYWTFIHTGLCISLQIALKMPACNGNEKSLHRSLFLSLHYSSLVMEMRLYGGLRELLKYNLVCLKIIQPSVLKESFLWSGNSATRFYRLQKYSIKNNRLRGNGHDKLLHSWLFAASPRGTKSRQKKQAINL